MSMKGNDSRLNGVYAQRQPDYYMQRIKLPAGVISAEQAVKVAQIADRFARGMIHLTTRGSMELHWLTSEDLPLVARQLELVGLNGRGACGGAVRGVVCGSLSAGANSPLEAMVRRIHCHFTGNPRFETLPKKFKIAVEADTNGSRHLIQDLALIPAADSEKEAWDVWTAGGLGREPQPAFLLAESVAAERIMPLIEVVLGLYAARTPAGKRLKHLLRDIGEKEFRSLVMAELESLPLLPYLPPLAPALLPEPAGPDHRLQAGIFTGELTGSELLGLANLAAKWADGMLLVTGDQNIVFHLPVGADLVEARQELVYAGFAGTSRRERVTLRVCPGNHECRMGLAPTRDLAAEIVALLGPQGMKQNWALSGCSNCCARPQLADAGIVVSRLVNEDGERTPRFDLYRGDGSVQFAAVVGQGLTLEELFREIAAIG